MQDARDFETPSVPVRRTRKMIRPDVQWKVIIGCVGVSMIVTLVNAHFPLYGLMQFAEAHAVVDPEFITYMETVISTCFVLSIILTLGLSIWLGTFLSFRFAGPIFAMKRYLLGLRDGTWGHECTLRAKDDLQDFREALNEGIGALRSRIVAQQEALLAAEAVLDGAKPGTPEAEALAQIRVELREFAIRFEDTDSIEDLMEASHEDGSDDASEDESGETQSETDRDAIPS